MDSVLGLQAKSGSLACRATPVPLANLPCCHPDPVPWKRQTSACPTTEVVGSVSVLGEATRPHRDPAAEATAASPCARDPRDACHRTFLDLLGLRLGRLSRRGRAWKEFGRGKLRAWELNSHRRGWEEDNPRGSAFFRVLHQRAVRPSCQHPPASSVFETEKRHPRGSAQSEPWTGPLRVSGDCRRRVASGKRATETKQFADTKKPSCAFLAHGYGEPESKNAPAPWPTPRFISQQPFLACIMYRGWHVGRMWDVSTISIPVEL